MADQDSTAEQSLKVCTECLRALPANTEHFREEKRTSIGLHSRCRECERAYRRARRASDPDADKRYYEENKSWLLPRMAERQRERRAQDPTPFLENNRRWREKHREEIRAKYREFYADNRDAERGRLTAYYEDNPEAKAQQNARREEWRRQNRESARAYVRNRRAKIKGAEGSHTAADIQKILEGQKSVCWWCGDKIKGAHHVDHRIPISRGGSNGPENLVVSCAPCNLKKNSKMPWEMETPRLF